MDYKEIFYKDSVEKQMTVKSDDGAIDIGNGDFDGETMELTESLCDKDELTFGACSASQLKFTVSGIQSSLLGKWLSADIKLKNEDAFANAYRLGRYKVNSDKTTADKTGRTVIAYDVLYDILQADVADWYNELLPETDSRVRLQTYRDSFFKHFGINQESIKLVNDDMWVERTIEPSELSGATVINGICEINGCMGYINRAEKFEYIYLEPISVPAEISKSLYTSATYEDYIVKPIDKLQIRQEEDDIGVIVGEGSNSYIIQDNFLVYGKSSGELSIIANNILSKIKGLAYRPFNVECRGNPCICVGTGVRVLSTYETIDSYVLTRTLKGVQSLSDTYEAAGNEHRTSSVNSIQKQIIQLKGKANILERSIEESKNTISDIEKGLKNEITQTASEFDAKLQNLQSEMDGEVAVVNGTGQPALENFPAYNWTSGPKIGDTLVKGLRFTYSDAVYRKHQRTLFFDEDTATTYRFIQKNGTWAWEPLGNTEFSILQKQITDLNLTAQGITADVESLSTKVTNDYITQVDAKALVSLTADGLLADISKTYVTNEIAEQMRLTLNATAEGLDMKVEKDKLITEINARAGNVKIKADAIDLTGLVTIKSLVSSGETKINADNITTGTINALTLMGCTLAGGSISIGGNNIVMNEAGLWVIGKGDAQHPNFRVDNDGNVTAQSGQIGNWSIGSGAIANNGTVLGSDGTLVLAGDNNAIQLGSNAKLIPTALFVNQGGYNGSVPWWGVFKAAAQAVTSDERIKQDVEVISDGAYERLFDALQTYTYRFKAGSGFKTDKVHMGFIAQHIKENLEAAGLPGLAVFDDDNPELLGVDKQELIALCVWQIQKLKKRVSELENNIGGAA